MKKSTLRIWQTDSLYKVLRDKSYDGRNVEKLNVKLYKNETEGVGFYCTPNRDGVLDLKVSNVLDENFQTVNDVSVEVSWILYVPITKPSASTKSELGEYPDAILPFEVAKRYGKNCLKANTNQEIWLKVKTEKTAKSGKYFVEIIVTFDGVSYPLTMQITVWDYILPSENHTKQYFIIDSQHLELAEGGGLEKYKRYYDDLLNYRINGSRLPFKMDDDYTSVTSKFIEQLRAYYVDDRVSVVGLPVFYNEEYTDVDYEKTEYLFNELIKACVQDGADYFSKAMTYLWILDEPHLTPAKIGYCKNTLPKFEKLRMKFVEQCENKASENALYGVIAKSLFKLPNVLTSGVLASILPEQPSDYKITWCPAFPSHDDAITLWQVWNKGEKWWYGCDWPVPPAPTYHIDDKLLSSRLLSWMQYSYGVTGNLYWRINYWARKQDGKLVYVNPYQQSSFATTNGEGTLVYPGKEYGLDSFAPTVRLESIRDGIEDFEALYALEKEIEKASNEYGIKGLSVNELLSPVYTRLFNKTVLPEVLLLDFERAREMVAEYLVATRDYGFVVTERNAKERKIIFYTQANNVEVVDGKLQKDGGRYVITECGELVTVKLNGEREATLYLKDAEREYLSSLGLNWLATVKKYSLQADPKAILQPYYDVLKDEKTTNYTPCTRDMSGLVSFIWRTETVILKTKRDGVTEIKLVVPKGEFITKETYETEWLDETCRVYAITTDKRFIEFAVENEKGSYPVKLYL